MINTEFFTEEQKKLNNNNRRKARRRLHVPKGYDLHHIDTELRYKDVERYIQWNDEDVIIITHSEHSSIHQKGENNCSKDPNVRAKQSASHTGKHRVYHEDGTWHME